jgi:hypothetical protein
MKLKSTQKLESLRLHAEGLGGVHPDGRLYSACPREVLGGTP